MDSFNFDGPEYPDAPGHRGIETSIAAAEAMAPKQGRLQWLTLQAMGNSGAVGLTADECAEMLGLDRWSIQPRISELRRKGSLHDSGLRRRNVTGKRAIVWTLSRFVRGPDHGEG